MCTLRNPTRLPPQKFMLTVIRNKVQLIDLICEDMAFHKDDISQHKLVLTGSDPVPVEINRGVIIKRQDMKTKQEEADTMIVQQVAEVKAKKVLVVADDTDIIIYLFFLPRRYSSFNLCLDGITNSWSSSDWYQCNR